VRLGVLGALPRSLNELTPAAIARVREMGFTGTGLPGGDDPSGVTTERAREVGRLFVDAGVELVEYGRYSTNLVTNDDAAREAGIASLREAFRVARAAGCPAVITGAGSLNPRSAWFPHPENFERGTLDRLVASLREAVKGAEDAGVLLGLECHTLTALRDAATTREVLDAVGSPALKVHLDPVNWMTVETVYRSGEATGRMFETLGPDRLLGAHSKGVAVEDKLIVHLSETVTGAEDDVFDHAALLRHSARMPSDFYVVIEHLPPDRMPAARQHLLEVASRTGVGFEGQ
jgi:sugar phosphate isomerase/epimerase